MIFWYIIGKSSIKRQWIRFSNDASGSDIDYRIIIPGGEI